MENGGSKVENQIFAAVFKRLITRMGAMSKELRSTENMVSSDTGIRSLLIIDFTYSIDSANSSASNVV
jgi:hypothetical protein